MKYIILFILSFISFISAGQIITTIAGADSFGYSGDGGPASSAGIGNTGDIKFDKIGNCYFGENNNTI